MFLKGPNTTVFNLQDRVKSFIKKSRFWEKCLESNQTECFDTIHDFLIENELRLNESVEAKIHEHLRGLGTKFMDYFPAMIDDNNWIRNPFDNTAIFASITLSA